MTDSVARLKELLFDRETATLAEISRRLDDIATAEQKARADLAATEQNARAELAASGQRQAADASSRLDEVTKLGVRANSLQEELARRIAALDNRLGTPQALRSSVAEVLDDIIVEARETKQDHVSRALAPIMVKTIKSELENNRDAMVEALYPITGQLVKAYVASAMKELTNRMNRRFQSNAAMLRVRSLFSGYSVSELAMADTQQLEVEELYLIRRGSGELLERWPTRAIRTNSDIHMSGVMAAINDFATQAFQTDGGHLRSFDLDDFTVYLRASPIHLLAAKCRGVPAPGIDALIDGEFLSAVARQHEREKGTAIANGHSPSGELLSELQQRLQTGIHTKYDELSTAGMPFNPVRALVATLFLAMIGSVGWYGWNWWSEEATRAEARTAIADTESMKGYPVLLDVGRGGKSIAISGVAPSEPAKRQLLQRLGERLPNVSIEDRGIASMPAGGPDLTPQIATVRRDVVKVESELNQQIGRRIEDVEKRLVEQTLQLGEQTRQLATLRSLDRASRRLGEALPEITALTTAVGSTRQLAGIRSEVESTITLLRSEQAAVSKAPPNGADDTRAVASFLAAAEKLRAAAATVSGVATPAETNGNQDRTRITYDVAAEELSLAAERLATATAATLQAASLRIPPPPTPRDRLRAYVGQHAIFFGNGDDFRDRAKADTVLTEVIKLARDANATLRIVGYTDERGTTARNAPLAQSRADKVVETLVAAGFPRARLIAVGRSTGPDLAPSTGPDSPNRRVEFEIAFNEEPVSGGR